METISVATEMKGITDFIYIYVIHFHQKSEVTENGRPCYRGAFIQGKKGLLQKGSQLSISPSSLGHPEE